MAENLNRKDAKTLRARRGLIPIHSVKLCAQTMALLGHVWIQTISVWALRGESFPSIVYSVMGLFVDP